MGKNNVVKLLRCCPELEHLGVICNDYRQMGRNSTDVQSLLTHPAGGVYLLRKIQSIILEYDPSLHIQGFLEGDLSTD